MRAPSFFIAAVVLMLGHLAAAPLQAQGQITPMTTVAEQRPGGWTVTPALDYAFVWDSNVLFENVGSEIVGEGLHMVKPNGVVTFRDRRTEFDLQYNGAFVQHPTLSSLNSYDQRWAINAMRQVSRRTSWFARHSATLAPTTDLVELVGVPFTRLGVHRQDVRTGVDTLLGRNTTLGGSYRFQWVDFKPTTDDVLVLAGGHNHGANLALSHALSRRVSVTGEYDVQRATVVGGGKFDIQNSWAGLEYRLSELVQASGGIGVSRLSGAEGTPARMGPSVRVEIARRTPSAEVGVLFNKSYAPNYGFGGTTDNEELTARLRVPVGRRLVTNASVSLRRNEPLYDGDSFFLRSLWFYGSVGYLVNDWMRVEAFSASARQMSDQPDGRINRYQLGIQITAATTARIR
jgi:hypothetical protein